MSVRQIAVVTVGRSDFGLYESVLEAIKSDSTLELRLMVSGAHFGREWGTTVQEIEAKGYAYERGLEMMLNAGSEQSVSKSLGVGVVSFAQAFATRKPDILVVLGDRMDMLSPVVAAIPYNIPIAHLYGGKVTEGAVDELVRHAITKMSHLHFASCEAYANRLLQMGEEPWRVFNFGMSGIDRIAKHRPVERKALCASLGLDPGKPFLLVTYHPVTLELQGRHTQIASVLGALRALDLPVVITYPNADPGNGDIIAAIETYAEANADSVRILRNAGSAIYLDLMKHAAAMVGNSSSGISEAPSFGLPVVNIGTRQAGFQRAANVIDIGYDERAIVGAIKKAIDPEFKEKLQGMKNPYGDGAAGVKIAEVLRTIAIDDRLLRKKFIDLPRSGSA